MSILDSLTPNDVGLPKVEETANAVLLEHVVDENRMFRPPIDPYRLAADLKVDVRTVALPPGLSGFIAKEAPEVPPVIYVNEANSRVRQRFTVAHELGHYIQETVLGNTTFQTLKREDGHADLGIHEKERWANGFAAAILMPAGATRRLYVDGESAQAIAERLNVSTMAMEYRLANLGLS